jgi:hypothetical protein
MKIDKKSLLESVVDTVIGFLINFPLSWISLAVLLMFTQDPLVIAFVQTFIITIFAVIRKYITRIYFKGAT